MSGRLARPIRQLVEDARIFGGGDLSHAHEQVPGLAGHVVLVEEVCEYLYAVDRLFFHLTAHLGGIAGLRLGRVSEVPENDRPFGSEPEQIARYWCERHAIPFLGSADIGHDIANRIVPFGLAR